MFNKGSGNYVKDCKLKMIYVPPQVLMPIKEGSEESSYHRALVSENKTVNISELNDKGTYLKADRGENFYYSAK